MRAAPHARMHECIPHLPQRAGSFDDQCACMRVYTCVSRTWLEEKSRGTEHYELRRGDDGGEIDEKEKDSGKLDGGEGARGEEVRCCLLLRGVLGGKWGGRRGGARGLRKLDGEGEGARPCRALRR